MELQDKLNQLQSQAQSSSDFLITKVQHLTDSFSKINQKAAKHAIAMSNSQKCIEYMDILLECLKTSQREEKLITRGVGTDIQPFLDSLNRIQASIKTLSDNPWKGSDRNINPLKQLRKVGLLQLNNLFISKLRQISEPLDLANLIRNGVDNAVIIDDESLEFIQKLAATINDGSVESMEFTKEFNVLRSKFLFESLLPLGTDAFTKRGSIQEPKSPSSSGYIEQFSTMMEWSAILFNHERKFCDGIFRMADVVHSIFNEITTHSLDILLTSIELIAKDLKEMKKSKQMTGFLNFIESINSIRSDFRMIINSFEGITDKQNIMIKNEFNFISACALFFDLKVNEVTHKPQLDGTIHENVHSTLTFVRKLLEHEQNLEEWVSLFCISFDSVSEYISHLLVESSKLIEESNKNYQQELHRQVYCLNNYTFVQNVIKENIALSDFTNEQTQKLLGNKFHTHFDAYVQCWMPIANTIEDCRKTSDEKQFKDKCKHLFNLFEDLQKNHKSVSFIDANLRVMIKSTIKDKLIGEYDLLARYFNLI
eukprot:NODE_764_length_4412_cov_0.313935.p1 type:complete len:539 gc:universal NODE_764_length_4412_cov_0.313935:276-1892(+)